MMLLAGSNTKLYINLFLKESNRFGYFVQPRTVRHRVFKMSNPVWVGDNDAFIKFNKHRFLKMLDELLPYQDRCLFITCPDVVGNHVATIERWKEWNQSIRTMGYPVAFVGQDGCNIQNIPWDEIDALFIGGTDKFKDSESREIILEAKQRGIWVHVGRVNMSRRRLQYCFNLGVDSIDGTAYSRVPEMALRWYQNQIQEFEKQRRLL